MLKMAAEASNPLKCSIARAGKLTDQCGTSSYSGSLQEYQTLSSCQRDIANHLKNLKVSHGSVIKYEWQLILARIGQFDELDSCPIQYTICPHHRDSLGIRWRASRLCKHPDHPVSSKNKPFRTVDLQTSQSLFAQYIKLVPVGSGNSTSSTLIF